MSLLWYDGMDHYNTSQMTPSGMWNSLIVDNAGSGFTTPTIAAGGRNGGSSLRAHLVVTTSGTSYARKTLVPGNATIVIGFAMKARVPQTLSQTITSIEDTAVAQVSLQVNADGTLSVVRGITSFHLSSNGTVLGTTSNSLTSGNFYYIELKVTIHPSAGTVDLRVNGVSWLSLTGQNTRATANTSWNGFWLGVDMRGSVNSTTDLDFDDYYVCDGVDATATQGFPYNDFQGDCIVQLTYPTADGFYTQFTPVGSSSHYQNVDDNPPNDDTDYNSDNNVGDRDSYTFTLPSTGGQILALMLLPYARKDDAGTRKIVDFVRVSSTNYDNAVEASIAQTYQFYAFLRTLNPATSARWLSGNKEIGIKIST